MSIEATEIDVMIPKQADKSLVKPVKKYVGQNGENKSLCLKRQTKYLTRNRTKNIVIMLSKEWKLEAEYDSSQPSKLCSFVTYKGT